MAFFEDDDIAGMLADWGNTLTVGAASKACLKDEFDDPGLEAEGSAAPQIKRQVQVTFRTTDFPALRGGDAVTVDGVEYYVWKRLAIGDGALTMVVLAGSGEETVDEMEDPVEVDLAPLVDGEFEVLHGFGATPSVAIIQMTSGGLIYFQTPRYDATKLYLVASSEGITGKALIW